MSATIPSEAAVQTPSMQPALKVTQWRVMASEWIKIRSLRSMWILLLAFVVSMVGISALVTYVTGASWNDMSLQEQATYEPIGDTLIGVILGQVLIAVFGVLLVTGEYATGMIRTPLSAVPRRFMLLFGKLAMSGGVAALAATIGCVAAFFIGQFILGDHGSTEITSTVLRAVLGSAFYLMVVSIVSSAIGFMVRSAAAGISSVLALLLLAPILGQMLQYEWLTNLLRFLPMDVGLSLTSVMPPDGAGSFSPTECVLILLAWVIAATVGAGLVLKRRDA